MNEEENNMNNRQDVPYQMVEELFKMVDTEIRARWAKRRSSAQVQIRPQQTGCEDTPPSSGHLRQLKPDLRNR